jgi:hypothetical protein
LPNVGRHSQSVFNVALYDTGMFWDARVESIGKESGLNGTGSAAFERLLSCLVESNQAWAKAAPVLAIGVTLTTFSRNGKPNKAAHHDLRLAAATLSFEATARGLAVHQMIGIQPERVRELYGVPDDAEPLTGYAIGYAGEAASLPESLRPRDLAPRTRKPLSELVFAGHWGHRAGFATP